MYNIIALIGEAGAGKDTLMGEVLAQAPYLHEIISCTTRPPREGEKYGVNYYYYTPAEFSTKVFDGEMLEYTNFNGWFYGTGLASLDESKINIGVFNPEGIRSLIAHPNCNVLVFLVRTADKIRLMRQLNREDNPDVQEIIRRFSTDTNDFRRINFNCIQIQNNTIDDFEIAVKEILRQVETQFASGQN